MTSLGLVPRPFVNRDKLSNPQISSRSPARGHSTFTILFVPKRPRSQSHLGSFPPVPHPRDQISLRIQGVDADSRGTIGYAFETPPARPTNPTHLLSWSPCFPTPVTMDILVSPTKLVPRHIERNYMFPDGIQPRNRTRALALASQRVTYHGCVSSDESRAVQKSHISIPTSQNRLGERPPVSVVPLLPTHRCFSPIRGATREYF